MLRRNNYYRPALDLKAKQSNSLVLYTAEPTLFAGKVCKCLPVPGVKQIYQKKTLKVLVITKTGCTVFIYKVAVCT